MTEPTRENITKLLEHVPDEGLQELHATMLQIIEFYSCVDANPPQPPPKTKRIKATLGEVRIRPEFPIDPDDLF